jgi:hypothetical protein
MSRLAEFVSRILRKPSGRPEGEEIAISPDVISSVHADGVVFLHIGSGAVFNSNPVGARIWQGLADRKPLAAVVSAIAQEFGVEPAQVGRDAANFLADLEAQGFLTRGASA